MSTRVLYGTTPEFQRASPEHQVLEVGYSELGNPYFQVPCLTLGGVPFQKKNSVVSNNVFMFFSLLGEDSHFDYFFKMGLK